MFSHIYTQSWEYCIERYTRNFDHALDETKKYRNPKFADYCQTMLSLVEQLRDDPEIPELNRIISHITLRLWHPDIPSIEVHITPIEKDILWIGINQFEEVAVPLGLAAKTVKGFLKITREKFAQLREIPEKDETGDIEDEFDSLPLEWIHAKALAQIFNIAVNHSYYELHLDELSKMPADRLTKLVIDMAEIRKLVMKTWEIAREKRTQEWLKELENDND